MMAGSRCSSSPRFLDDYDDNDSDLDELLYDSDDAPVSESEQHAYKRPEEEFTEIKEQMYQDKLAQLKKQLSQLQDGTLPEYLKRLKRIEQQYKERLRLNEAWQQICIENVERRCQEEQENSVTEYQQKELDLKDKLIADLEEKKKQVEVEKQSLELHADNMDFKPISTRKLRRRPNTEGTSYQTSAQEKRRKQSPTLQLLLEDSEILDDLKLISKVSGKPFSRKTAQQSSSNEDHISCDARIEDGKLYYEKRWYNRGQAIYADSKETGKYGAVIHSIAGSEVWVKKSSDGNKVRIMLCQLQKGKYTIRRRST